MPIFGSGNIPAGYAFLIETGAQSGAIGTSYYRAPAVSAGIYTLTATTANFPFSGNNANLTYVRALVLTATTANYPFSGSNVNLTYVPAATVYTLTATAANYPFSGKQASLTYTPAGSYMLTVSAGAFAFTGRSINLTPVRAYVLAAGAGSFPFTGYSIALAYGAARQYTLDARSGNFPFSGYNADFKAYLFERQPGVMHFGHTVVIPRW
jgi:hypothetical protein